MQLRADVQAEWDKVDWERITLADVEQAINEALAEQGAKTMATTDTVSQVIKEYTATTGRIYIDSAPWPTRCEVCGELYQYRVDHRCDSAHRTEKKD